MAYFKVLAVTNPEHLSSRKEIEALADPLQVLYCMIQVHITHRENVFTNIMNQKSASFHTNVKTHETHQSLYKCQVLPLEQAQIRGRKGMQKADLLIHKLMECGLVSHTNCPS